LRRRAGGGAVCHDLAVAAAYYFAHFLIILPLIAAFEKPLPLPGSITEAVLAKHGEAAE
jgi:ubiquinol-cytochrome c reductase cytochrome b subunit